MVPVERLFYPAIIILFVVGAYIAYSREIWYHLSDWYSFSFRTLLSILPVAFLGSSSIR